MKFRSGIQKLIIFIHLILLFSGAVYSQNKYWIFFNDKEGVEFDPYEYFDPRAIERRQKNNISLNDFTDRPVNQEYIAQVISIADSLTFISRWFNAAVIYSSAERIDEISALPFVSDVKPSYSSGYLTKLSSRKSKLTPEDSALLWYQTARLQAENFIAAGVDGSGIRIAIFDAGFPSVNTSPVFTHIRDNNRIIKTFDFVKKNENVYGYNQHGTMVLSCIAGKLENRNMGLATGAEFLLARTEMASLEPFTEEENWLAAVEWADKNGADIINSSLGYTNKRYFKEEMTGELAFVSRAANMAASKGILVVNSAGNEGTGSWTIMGAPADADSVLSVGGTNPYQDIHVAFSSFGPTAAGKRKPNVSAPGIVIAEGKKGLTETQGTSFSGPLVAGFAACAWQTNRDLSNMELFREIERSGHLYPYFDLAHGYGIPQASYFTNEKKQTAATFVFTKNEEKVIVKINDEFIHETEKSEKDEALKYNLYFKLEDATGKIYNYGVVRPEDKEAFSIYLDQYSAGDKLIIHFEGYTDEFIF